MFSYFLRRYLTIFYSVRTQLPSSTFAAQPVTAACTETEQRETCVNSGGVCARVWAPPVQRPQACLCPQRSRGISAPESQKPKEILGLLQSGQALIYLFFRSSHELLKRGHVTYFSSCLLSWGVGSAHFCEMNLREPVRKTQALKF